MHEQPQTPERKGPSGISIALLVCEVFAISVEPFLHREMGQRYMDKRALYVFPLVMLFTLGWPHSNVVPMLWFLGAYILMSAINRIDGLRRRLRGEEPPHSYYNGYPRLKRVFPWMNEFALKRMMEPMLLFFAAVLIGVWNPPLCGYLMCCAAALPIKLAVGDFLQRQRQLDLHDAMIEQRQIRERYDRSRRNRQ